jgi:hypothetical protein
MASVILRKKVHIPRHSEVYRRVNSESRNGRKYHDKKFSKLNKQHVFVRDMLRNGIRRIGLYFLSMERTFEHFSPLRNDSERNSKSFLFHGMAQNGIPRVFFYFCSMIQYSEHFSPLRNSLELNSKGFLFHGTDRIPQEQTNCSVYSVFCGIIIFSEIANPT